MKFMVQYRIFTMLCLRLYLGCNQQSRKTDHVFIPMVNHHSLLAFKKSFAKVTYFFEFAKFFSR
jgi:hypothetical protein